MTNPPFIAREIRVRGRVQGVGFRPAVWRYARDLGLRGDVLNDAEGVVIRVGGGEAALAAFVARLESEPPPLARIDRIEITPFHGWLLGCVPGGTPADFSIAESVGGAARTQVAPDAAVCPDCAREILDPSERRHRYPFTTCTHCGPRLTIIDGVPYDRAKTAMAPFPLCDACLAEYRDPADRRFHAEAIACRVCGPKAALVRLNGGAVSPDPQSMRDDGVLDDVDAARRLIQKGEIVAIKGLGGYHLACDATQAEAVARLRSLKRREAKPFALMARDLEIIRRYASATDEEARLLASPQAPIVLLRADGPEPLPDAVAPGLTMLGFMLPMTPLHLLILQRMTRPVVMTSGNLSDEPQVTDDAELKPRLGGVAAYAVMHDRRIANRMDDSVARVMAGRARVLRRARGYAPAPIALPAGFERAAEILAMGGELKATFCIVKDGEATLSQHQGDLENAAAFADYRKSLALYAELFAHRPAALAVDRHPEYLSSKLGRERAAASGSPLIEVQHHHAHIASCLAENGRPLSAPVVLGVVLDGLGWGDGGAIWGGEFLLADYAGYERLGTFKPVGMLGGAQAARQPWRNLYAHLMAGMGWDRFEKAFAGLDVHRYLAGKPRPTLDAMLKRGVNTPLASSCGRLFDAVAAALDVCRERQAYEGEAGARLEAAVDEHALLRESDDLAYPFTIPEPGGSGIPYLEPLAMWNAILGDLALKTPVGVMAARFHKGLTKAIVAMTLKLASRDAVDGPRFDAVALSGGCFQNRVLFEETVRRLEAEGFAVLSHAEIPANDGGLALGQAVIAAAQLMA